MLNIAFIPFMAWMSRCCGGGFPKIPFGLDQFITALPYLLFYPQIGWWSILGYAGAVLGLRSGHGMGFHYNRPFKEGAKPEKVQILIPSSLPVWARKALIMLLTGLAVTIAPAILLCANGFYLAGAVLALSGGLKAVAYLAPRTETSEYIRGGFLGLGVVIALVV